ncbi:MAG: N-6 DNA methylase [Sporomusaceae bacterium]|nr:N-6 DNA methylase [Sporomusaceae bacterium]
MRRIGKTAASVYEQSLDRQTRQAGGIYYTPPYIIEYILLHTLEQADVTANPWLRVLDPACGSGRFLLAAYDVLLRKFQAQLPQLRRRHAAQEAAAAAAAAPLGPGYWREENLHRHVVEHCLFGADSDAAALQMTAAALAAKAPGREAAANLVHCDSLYKWEQEPQPADTGRDAAAFWRRDFDFVIGNPPYIPVTRMSPAQKAYYRSRYQCAAGRLNTFSLFLERAIEKASRQVAMIVPSRLLLNTQYGAIRRHILQHTALERIYEASEAVFADTVVDTVVLIMRKRGGSALPPVVIERRCQAATVAEAVRPEALLSTAGSFISFAAGRAEFAAVADLEKRAVALGSVATIRDGIIQGAVGGELFLGARPQPDPHCKPVLRGQLIEPFFCGEPEYICYDRERLTQLEASRTQGRGRGLRLRSPAIFEQVKIVSRQTADHIIAAMDEQGCYYMNTLHGTTVTDAAFDPWYVLAVMNSALIRCWYAWRFSETGRSFAQVKIANLRTLPVLSLPAGQREQAACLARQATAARGERRDCRPLLQEIDELLYTYSGLSAQTVQNMRAFAGKLGGARRPIRRK